MALFSIIFFFTYGASTSFENPPQPQGLPIWVTSLFRQSLFLSCNSFESFLLFLLFCFFPLSTSPHFLSACLSPFVQLHICRLQGTSCTLSPVWPSQPRVQPPTSAANGNPRTANRLPPNGNVAIRFLPFLDEHSYVSLSVGLCPVMPPTRSPDHQGSPCIEEDLSALIRQSLVARAAPPLPTAFVYSCTRCTECSPGPSSSLFYLFISPSLSSINDLSVSQPCLPTTSLVAGSGVLLTFLARQQYCAKVPRLLSNSTFVLLSTP